MKMGQMEYIHRMVLREWDISIRDKRPSPIFAPLLVVGLLDSESDNFIFLLIAHSLKECPDSYSC